VKKKRFREGKSNLDSGEGVRGAGARSWLYLYRVRADIRQGWNPLHKTKGVCSSSVDDAARTMAAAGLVQRLAVRNEDLAEHSLATGAVAARLASQMGLEPSEIVEASLIGTLHEVGAIVVSPAALSRLGFASASEVLRVQRAERRAAVAIVRATPAIADLADAVGSVFDDLVPSLTARVAIVADQFDYLTRWVSGRRGVSVGQAIVILEMHAGVRYDRRVVQALAATYGAAARRIQRRA
jgi:response regulator RpfG family c-di-GMP phosphodiesterase